MRSPTRRARGRHHAGRHDRWRLLGALLACALTALAPVTGTARSGLLDRARAHMADRDPESAYALLAPHEPRLAGTPEYDYLLGIAALDTGRLTNAVFALERVLAVEPGNALARAEIARTYLLLGERETSRREFETVREADIPPAARQAVERYLTAFRETPEEGADLKAFVAVTVGYDSNVNAASDIESVAIPSTGGAIFQIDPTAVEADDYFSTIAAGTSVSLPVTDDTRFNAGVNLYQKFFPHETLFETGSVNGYVGLDWRNRRTVYTLAAQGEHFEVDHSTFRNAYGGLVQLRHLVSSVSQLTGYTQFTRLEYSGNQRIRDANRWTVGGAYSTIVSGRYSPSAFFGGFAGIENPNASGVDHLEYRFGGARLGGQLNVGPRTSLFGFFNLEHRQYDAADPLFLDRRRDTRLGFRVGGEYDLASAWTLTPAVEYITNDSNIEIHEFDRWILSGTLRVDID